VFDFSCLTLWQDPNPQANLFLHLNPQPCGTAVNYNKQTFPFTEEKIRALKVGDEVLISGVVFTGRDAARLASVSRRR
jgi:hypothetical protein